MSERPRRLSARDGSLPRADRLEIARLLEAGEVVALPTETVYGLAARADRPEPLERLRALKGRPADLALSVHVGEPAALGAVELPHTVGRVVERFWPGPLTLVVRERHPGPTASADGWTGFRMPAHTATRELLAALPFPVVMTSANRSGEPPLAEPDAIAATFGEGLALLVDAGPPKLNEASTVLRVGPGRFEVLREGLLAAPELRRAAGLRIAFTCTGNTCRSPMAEGLARRHLARALEVADGEIHRFGFEVGSMGVFASPGAPASEHGVTAMARREIDLSRHRARLATEELVAAQDRVYGLTESHVEALQGLLPAKARGRVELLDPDGRGVPDPIGGSLADYEACAGAIDAALEKRLATWI